MGHTNSTANLSLPQFIGTDKPTWLGDVNGAFSAIDSYAGTNDAAVAAAVSDASSAVSQAAAAVNTANTANTTAGNASTAANNAIGVANTANAIAGTVDAKVGLLADLHTSDRTSIVNAINELADAQTSGTVDYSTSEHKIGTWIDGSDLYEITVDTGTLPNTTDSTVALGVTYDKIISVNGSAIASTSAIPLPYYKDAYISAVVAIIGANIRITTGSDMTGYADSYVTVRYTK